MITKEIRRLMGVTLPEEFIEYIERLEDRVSHIEEYIEMRETPELVEAEPNES